MKSGGAEEKRKKNARAAAEDEERTESEADRLARISRCGYFPNYHSHSPHPAVALPPFTAHDAKKMKIIMVCTLIDMKFSFMFQILTLLDSNRYVPCCADKTPLLRATDATEPPSFLFPSISRMTK